MSVLKTLFAYPYGIVLGNLIASAMTGSLTTIWLHWHANKRHKEHMNALRIRVQGKASESGTAPETEGREAQS